MKFFDRFQVWLHLLGWLIFISLPFLTLPDSFWNRQDLISLGTAQGVTSLLIIVYFYVNLTRLTPALLQHRNTSRFLLIVLAMLISVVFIRVGLYQLFPPASMPMPPHRPDGPPMYMPDGRGGEGGGHARGPGTHSPWPSALGMMFSLGFALMVSSLIALFRHHTRSQKTQQQMELEKISAELAMLKLQVSPHFLFNTLNNIRWLARKKSDQTEAAVVSLAQLLRYMLYQAQQDRVPLRQEVQHLQDYIDLQTMRLTRSHVVSFRCEGPIDAYQIEPLLFIPFVENAFKYGVQSQPTGDGKPEKARESHINISLSVVDRMLTFCTENPLPTPSGQATDASSGAGSGIGIANVRKRLMLHYPGQHELQLTSEADCFRVVLTINLHNDQVALHRY